MSVGGVVMPKSVLIIEDDDNISSVIAEVLRDQRYTVTHTASPQETHALFAASPPPSFDLILSDSFRLPSENAYIWLAVLKTLTPAPIVIPSGWPAGTFEDWDGRGFAAVLPKPFDLDDIVTLVARVLAAPPH
jgi:DNA-binding NtrC family response regulator